MEVFKDESCFAVQLVSSSWYC